MNQFRTSFGALAFAALLLGWFAYSGQSSPATQHLDTFDFGASPYYSDYKNVVTRYIKAHSTNRSDDVCVIGRVFDNGPGDVWVLWQQGRQLILWEGQDDLYFSRRKLHVPRDVVKTESEINGSNYLVTQEWVDDLRKSCAERGVKLHIRTQKQ
ncbi:MAG: hypothetical protein JWM26_755 [Betaproteobacteria bacterium]|nr:hypothetical protein [Betaproteobacteria bacterium]